MTRTDTMLKTAIICGSGLTGSKLLKNLEYCKVETDFGTAAYFVNGDCIFLPRHGQSGFVPPHEINYRANIRALADAGAQRIISVNSVGSMKDDLVPGELVLVEDVFCPWRRDSFFDGEKVTFSVPSIDGELSAKLSLVVRSCELSCFAGAVYCQTLGPTAETPAEIRFLKDEVGDVVGMTLAQEVFLASELDIPIASFCMVDNFANGISEQILTEQRVRDNAARNRAVVENIIEQIINGALDEGI
ncbi:MAG: MTAP family purine nucleoside phosphorylase [Planctomycetota bacterium]|nr:MTAP family purine nucleoside phosphorylase [Planctomycetota bacterium]